ncbi:MAG: B12-binding domain-containing radical SAM protein [Acidobacteriaceae bacterium]|nr:B12-binding domain-containing radical SAM protein [Acidobacteriaceae bacterium]
MHQVDGLSILKSSGITRARDTSRPVLLVGFQRHSNLGIGYLAASLRREGYDARIFDFEANRQEILEEALALSPVLIGFSLIFQSYIPWFGSLIRYLRENGVNCHFTMGGHFPSLSYQHTLELIPELDSVVRFEGEETLLELVDLLSLGGVWKGLPGLAYRKDSGVVSTPMRHLVDDLDTLPYPVREFNCDGAILGRNITPMLASRGCARTCSFCSIHMFYRTAPGKVVRTRKPAQVVNEMRFLLEEHGRSIFLFQDDDFPLFGPVWQRWANEFVQEIHRNGLKGRVVWKINCRADAVEPELFKKMHEAGLYMVYMGLESGTEEGLKTLHKQITVEQNVRAVQILKALGIIFEFGFMLLDPSSTFESVRANVRFLRTVAGDGSSGVTFGRMVPYDGTPIKDDLQRAGRLKGDVCRPDYDFLDPRLDDFYKAIIHIVNVTGWTHGLHALSPQINVAWNEVAVIEHLFPNIPQLDVYRETLREVTRESNEALFRIIENTTDLYSGSGGPPPNPEELRIKCDRFANQLLNNRTKFLLENQGLLLETLERDRQAAFA